MKQTILILLFAVTFMTLGCSRTLTSSKRRHRLDFKKGYDDAYPIGSPAYNISWDLPKVKQMQLSDPNENE